MRINQKLNFTAAIFVFLGVFLSLAMSTAAGDTNEKNQPSILAKVIVQNDSQLQSLLAMHLDIATGNRKEGYYIIVTNQEEVSFLRGQGFTVEVVIPDLAERAERAGYGAAE